MINNSIMLALICLVVLADIAQAKQPPIVPSLYANGPVSTLLSITNLNPIEKTLHALYESTLDIAEELIDVTSCSAAAGKYTFNALANGSVADPKNNEIRIISPGKTVESLSLRANLDAQNELRGQQILVEQSGHALLGDTEITNYASTILFNTESSIMTAESSANVRGVNGAADAFQNKMTKHFYVASDSNDHYVDDWGLQSLSKFNFPIEMYWSHSKLYRNNGVVERTIFIRDRLIGPTPCRILIEGSRPNNQNSIVQKGLLTISTTIPTEPNGLSQEASTP